MNEFKSTVVIRLGKTGFGYGNIRIYPPIKAHRINRILSDIPVPQSNWSSYSADYLSAIKLGGKPDLPLLEKIIIPDIEAGDIATENKPTPMVETAIPACVERVLLELN